MTYPLLWVRKAMTHVSSSRDMKGAIERCYGASWTVTVGVGVAVVGEWMDVTSIRNYQENPAIE